MSVRRFEDLSGRARRRLLLRALVRPTLSTGSLVLLYFVLPLDQEFTLRTVVELGIGVLLMGSLVAWQVPSIVNADHPLVRAIQAMSTSVPLFLLLFATTYFMLDNSQDSAFNEPMTRLDSLYFTVTVFATVGFGDIVAQSQMARLLVLLQMIGDLIVIGVVLKVLLNAVQRGLRRRARDS